MEFLSGDWDKEASEDYHKREADFKNSRTSPKQMGDNCT
jgi:hypothetical protein